MKLIDKETCPCGSGKLYGKCHIVMRRTTTTMTNLSHLPLTVIPEPDPNTRAVFEKTIDSGTTFFINPEGHYSLDCGACGASLAVVSDRQQVSGVVLHCAACGKFNNA